MYRKSNILYTVTFLCIVLLNSCTVSKKLLRDKTKTKTESVNSGEVSIKRASDTLELTIPKIVYKDTTIYKRGRKSTVYLNYDKQGNAKVISVCDSIAIFKKWYNQINVNQKNDVRDKDKETVVSNTIVIYIFIGIAILFVFIKVVNKFI
mgnify:CR=1 FL=1